MKGRTSARGAGTRSRGAAALVLAASAAACASGGSSYSLYAENDAFGADNRDRYYTNGVRISGLYTTEEAPRLVRAAARTLPDVLELRTSQLGWVLGHEMYTPDDLERDPPDPDDRPYAGWLYVGLLASMATRADDGPAGDHVNVLELDLGVVGPSSQADRLQKQFHGIVSSARGEAWDHQLHDEVGVVLQLEHRRRLLAGETVLGGEWDLLGTGGIALGNVFDHATLGVLTRWGTTLPRDFGPNTIHSTAVDVPDVRDGIDGRVYVFGGAQGRAVARNLFLDGNTFRDSPSVDSRVLVGELRAGFAFEWGAFRFAYTHIARSREFDGQDEPQTYGSLALTWQTRF